MRLSSTAPLAFALSLAAAAVAAPASGPSAAPASSAEQVAIDVFAAASAHTVRIEAHWNDARQRQDDATLALLHVKPPHDIKTSTMPDSGLETGFLWDAQGHVVTDASNAAATDVQFIVTLPDGQRCGAKVVGVDARSDIAVLQVDGAVPAVAPLLAAPGAGLRVGQRLFALGNAYGQGLLAREGPLASLERDIPGAPAPLFVVDIITRAGDAGGPILDSSGRLAGMARAGWGVQGSPLMAMTGADVVGKVVPILIRDGRVVRAALGINVTPTSALVDIPGLPPGMAIVSVPNDGAAAKAGLQGTPAGSPTPVDVITRIDGQAVGTSGALRAVFDRLEPGDHCTLTVWRAGATRDVVVELGTAKD